MFTINGFSIKLLVTTASTVLSLAVIKPDRVQAQSTTVRFNINPRAAFINTNHFIESIDSVPFLLSDLGISPGETIRLESFGSISPFGDPGNEDYIAMIAAFSNSDTLIADNGVAIGPTTDRIPGATNAFFPNGCLPIQCLDGVFYISRGFTLNPTSFNGITVQVPTDAQFLFISAADSRYEDNVDSDGDFAVGISTTSVPEPSSNLALGALATVWGISSAIKRKQKK